MKHYVYALCEPDTLAIRYIGCTKNMRNRLSAHINNMKYTDVVRWVHSLKKRGLIPTMTLLCICPDRESGLFEEGKRILAAKRKYGDQILNTNKTEVRLYTYRDLIEFNGERRNVSSWAQVLGVPRRELFKRLRSTPPNELFPVIRQQLIEERATVAECCESTEVPNRVQTTAMSHSARKARRQQIVNAVWLGQSKESVAEQFGVTVATVNLAVRKGRVLLSESH